MPLIRINAQADTPVLHKNPHRADLSPVLRARDPGAQGPVIIMVHGFKYCPGHVRACPHQRLFSMDAHSGDTWPRALGFGLLGPSEGLGVAFGWQARGGLPTAHHNAALAGEALADLVSRLRALWPDRPVHVLSHSMGSEVVFEALHHLPAQNLSRIILMTAASFRGRADAALATPAGRSAELINITSRENDLFDFLYECLMNRRAQPDITLGIGLDAPNSVTLQLDCPITLAHLARLGRPIDAPHRRVCHWSAYARRGTLRFYSDLLRRPERFPLALLRQGLPNAPAPRWCRLAELPDALTAWRRPDPRPTYTSVAP